METQSKGLKVKCAHCETVTLYGPGRAKMIRQGIYPLRCAACERLLGPLKEHPILRAYMTGTYTGVDPKVEKIKPKIIWGTRCKL